MQLVSIDGLNVLKMPFPEIILLLRTRANESRTLVFNLSLGEKSLMRKISQKGFGAARRKSKRESVALKSLRRAVSKSYEGKKESDPFWIYKHKFSNALLSDVEKSAEKRQIRAATYIQKIFRSRSTRREMIARQYYVPIDVEVVFKSTSLGLQLLDCNNLIPLDLPKDARKYNLCIRAISPSMSEYSCENSSNLRVGDIAVRSGDVEFENKDFDTVLAFLKNAMRPTRVVFRRYEMRDAAQRPQMFDIALQSLRKQREVAKNDAAIKLQAMIRGRQSRNRVHNLRDAMLLANNEITPEDSSMMMNDTVSQVFAEEVGVTAAASHHLMDEKFESTSHGVDDVEARTVDNDSSVNESEGIERERDELVMPTHEDVGDTRDETVVAPADTEPETTELRSVTEQFLIRESTAFEYDTLNNYELPNMSVLIPTESTNQVLSFLSSREGQVQPADANQSRLQWEPDAVMLDRVRTSEMSLRKYHNKEIIAAFLKWHDRRDRPARSSRRTHFLPPMDLSVRPS